MKSKSYGIDTAEIMPPGERHERRLVWIGWGSALAAVAMIVASTASFWIVPPGGHQSVMLSLGDCGVFPFCVGPGQAWVVSVACWLSSAPARRRLWLWVVLPPAAWLLSLVALAVHDRYALPVP